MIRLMLIITACCALMACNKIKEKVEEKKVLDFITTGQWKVASYSKDGADYTASFNAYAFQFKTNNTVDALKNGTIQSTGTWSGDSNAYTITASFPGTAQQPLPLLNGVWQLLDGGDNFTTAKKEQNGTVCLLRLERL